MAKDKGRGKNARRASIAEMEDTDPMTREELLEAFGRSGPEPETGDPAPTSPSAVHSGRAPSAGRGPGS